MPNQTSGSIVNCHEIASQGHGNQSDDYDIQFTSPAYNETRNISGGLSRMNTVVSAFDRKNPPPARQSVKGEASELFDRADGSRVLERVKRSTRLSAESNALINFKQKYNLK